MYLDHISPSLRVNGSYLVPTQIKLTPPILPPRLPLFSLYISSSLLLIVIYCISTLKEEYRDVNFSMLGCTYPKSLRLTGQGLLGLFQGVEQIGSCFPSFHSCSRPGRSTSRKRYPNYYLFGSPPPFHRVDVTNQTPFLFLQTC